MQVFPLGMCPECGATVSAGRSWRDHFHALLALEWEIPGGPGELAHFLAVGSYGLQHPEAMGYTIATVIALRAAVADVLDGFATLEEIRRRTRTAAAAAGRITRRGDENAPRWVVANWPMVITDVLQGGAVGYGRRVPRWAESIIRTATGLGL